MRGTIPTASAAVLLLALAGPAGARSPIAQTFYIPLPEQQVRAALTDIFPGRGPSQCDLRPGRQVEEPVISYISITPVADGTVIHYDHWEDGYETDIASPAQSSTETWGDGDPGNGAPPGLPADRIGVGDVIVLHNPVWIGTRATVLDFDGGDKLAATIPIAVTRAAWASGTRTRLAGAVEVFDTREWGRVYRAPVGEDVGGSEMFEHTALLVMAMRGGTRVAVDADADGVAETAFVLDEGESRHVRGGVRAGATVTATEPVQAALVTGDVCALFQSRWFALLPENLWSGSYYTPVGSTAGRPTTVFAYNPNPGPITVGWATAAGRQPDAVVPGGAVASFEMPIGSGAHLFSADGSPFFAVATVDSGESVYDWGFTLIPDRLLTPQALLGWGAGRDLESAEAPDENGSPAWVTPVLPEGASGPVAVCADYNGDNRGALADADGGRYDRRLVLGELESARVYDPDGDQTGMILYVCDGSGARLAAAWGEDAARASPAEPGLDLGTTVPPLPSLTATKDVELEVDADGDGFAGPGDTVRYLITIRNTGRVTLGAIALLDELPAHTRYEPGSTVFDDGTAAAPLPDAGLTPFPLDEGGATLGTLPVGGLFTVTFLVVIDDPLPPGVDTIVNRAVIRSPGGETEVEVDLPLRLAPGLELHKSAEVGAGGGIGTGTQGYWKNHPEAWPVAAIAVGGVPIERDAAIPIMRTPGAGDRTYDLFRQLVAAMLNARIGAATGCVADVIDAADAWMAAHPPGSGVGAGDGAWKDGAAALHATLDDYNNGRLCAPHRDDASASPGSFAVVFTIVVANTGDVPLAGVQVRDPAVPSCDADVGDLGPGAGATLTCEAAGVQGDFTNVAFASGTAPDGAAVEARGEVFVDVPGAGADDGGGSGDPAEPGTRSAAWWRRNPQAWPVLRLDAGGRSYEQEAALEATRPGAGRDRSRVLLRELIAARLNLLLGADVSCVRDLLGAADAWLERHPPGSGVGARARPWRKAGSPLAAKLSRYNRGLLCAPGAGR